MKKLALTLSFILVVFLSFGQREEYTHDGFFLNLSLGVNFTSINTKVDNLYDIDFTGTGSAFDVLVGGTLSENLALHATLSGMSMIDPDFDTGTESGSTEDTSMGTSFFGAGVTYYTESNFFFSPNLGRAVIFVDGGDETVTSDGGVGIILRAGKEWWVSKQWGLGVSVAYRGAFGSTDLPDDFEEKWSSNNFSISFSATLN